MHPLVETDLNQAIKECKQVQKEWKTIGPTQQKKRKVLWKKFRTACDFIFNKREEINNCSDDELYLWPFKIYSTGIA